MKANVNCNKVDDYYILYSVFVVLLMLLIIY